jgi:hypothetical protein
VRGAVAALAAVLAVTSAGALASCGDHGAAATSPPRPGKTDPVAPPDLHGQVLPTTRLPLLTAASAGRLTSTSWGLQKVSGRDLYLGYEIGGGCDSDRGVYVQETPARVLVGHYVLDDSAGHICTDEMRIGYGVVHLGRPLGSRPLVHTMVDVTW